MKEITDSALAAELLARYGVSFDVIAPDTQSGTFKTAEGRGESHWAFTTSAGEIDEIRSISYREYCDLNDMDPDY